LATVGSIGKFAADYLILLGLAVAAQSLTHVYRSNLNQPDEGSHYVSSLMIHDYIVERLPSNSI
jgi:hypothetical protein